MLKHCEKHKNLLMLKAWLKQCDFSSFLNLTGSATVRMWSGRSFQVAGPACENARSPNFVRSRGRESPSTTWKMSVAWNVICMLLVALLKVASLPSRLMITTGSSCLQQWMTTTYAFVFITNISCNHKLYTVFAPVIQHLYDWHKAH